MKKGGSSELVAIRGKWQKERTRLYDRETGLPTVAVVMGPSAGHGALSLKLAADPGVATIPATSAASTSRDARRFIDTVNFRGEGSAPRRR